MGASADKHDGTLWWDFVFEDQLYDQRQWVVLILIKDFHVPTLPDFEEGYSIVDTQAV